jgi:hypothetical protein
MLSWFRKKKNKCRCDCSVEQEQLERLFMLGAENGYVDACLVVKDAIEDGKDPLDTLDTLQEKHEETMNEAKDMMHRLSAEALEEYNERTYKV